MLSLSIFLVLLVGKSLTFNLFNKVDLPNKSGAVCLDGSIPAFYLWVPDGVLTLPNKVLIYFD
jgi:hypothetical protein